MPESTKGRKEKKGRREVNKVGWIWNAMMAFALFMFIGLIATFLALDASKQMARKRPQVYEVMAVRMKGDQITLQPGWTPFSVNPEANVVYVIKEVMDSAKN